MPGHSIQGHGLTKKCAAIANYCEAASRFEVVMLLPVKFYK